MIVAIGYDDAFRASGPGANGHAGREAAEREATLLDLRHRFRGIRRTLVTFASGHRYVAHQRTLTVSAAQSGEFHTIEAWTFDRLRATPFFAENREILQRSRGQGYWLWKPYILWRALEASDDGDLVVYDDCLPEAGNVFGRSVLPMLAWLADAPRRLAITRKPAPNTAWTKRDCFHLMGCDGPEYWEPNQVIATYMALVAGPDTRRLVADWLAFCRDPRLLTDEPNTCGLENFADFQEHRHDQSVLSNLLIRERFETPDILFGRDIATKHLQDMLGLFEDALVRARLSAGRVSLGKPWTLSSPSVWSPRDGVMTEYPAGQDFFFHTDEEDGPWWLLDLEADHRVDRIEVVNRPDPRFAWRANRLQVRVGRERAALRPVFDAVAASWDALTPLSLDLRGETVRYVEIGLDTRTSLHLKDVAVFGRRAE